MSNRFKTVVLGNSGVGKTSILYRIKYNLFKDTNDSTIGCEFMSYDYDDIKLMIWDTAGQENFKAFTPSFCRSAIISIIVFDISDKKSFLMIREWINMSSDIEFIYIIGNKCDIEPSEKIEYDMDLYTNDKIKYLGEVSAKNNIRIDEIFKIIIDDLKVKNLVITPNNTINISKILDDKKSYCC